MHMRLTLAVVAFLHVATHAPAQAPKANALTDEEAANGWILLFDGKNPLELLNEGDSEIVDGVLVVGGERPSRVEVKPRLGNHFELRLEYRTEGAKHIDVKAAHKSFFEYGFSSGSLDRRSKNKDEWIEIIYTGAYDPGTDARSVDSQFRAVGEAVFTKRGIGGGTGAKNTIFSFEIPAGSKFYIRNIKLKTDPAAPDLFLPIIAGIVLVLAILGLILLMRLRRKKETASEG
ncbi:MAG TPA: hypothetical protein VKE98_03615 [Gemmataceae bacterium]|nr:hypothetical protein [Gemmataceae bacterium]